jgi:hypothetical protein
MSKANQRKYKSSGRQPCEICGECMPLEEHHLRGRDVPNPHGKWNTAMVCRNDHARIHYGMIIIEGRFNTGVEYELIWHNEGDESITGEECVVHLIKR